MPRGSDKEAIRKVFYRTLLKDLGPNFNQLETMFRQADTMLYQTVHVTIFQNVLLGVSASLIDQPESIKIIADDFNPSGIQHQVDYPMFVARVQREYQKQSTLHKVYLSFYQLLVFRESADLYETVFRKNDRSTDRRFARDEFSIILQKSIGTDKVTAHHDTTQFFFEFEPPKNPGYIKYLDIEADYREYIEQLRKNNRLPMLTSLPEILRILQRHC